MNLCCVKYFLSMSAVDLKMLIKIILFLYMVFIMKLALLNGKKNLFLYFCKFCFITVEVLTPV